MKGPRFPREKRNLHILEGSDHHFGLSTLTGKWVSHGRGNQDNFLQATMTVVALEFVCEIMDAALLKTARSDTKLWGPFKLKMPWAAVIIVIRVGVASGRNSALPVPAGWVGLNGKVDGK